MLIPDYWAEARVQHRGRKKQITIRRWGWSDVSLNAATEHAEKRASEALDRAIRGEKLAPREPRVPYNGADGFPIREEVLARYDDVVVTRNSYGAHCLNVSNVLIADIDLDGHPTFSLWGCVASLVTVALSVAIGLWMRSMLTFAIALIVGLACVQLLWLFMKTLTRKTMAERKVISRAKIANYAAENAGWSLRIYETPNGLRVFATHRLFEPDDPEVEHFFDACGTDPIYRLMCRNQKCFRARVTAKPWRAGVLSHMKPQPGVWPVVGDKLAARNAWIEEYEKHAQLYSACHYLESAGRGAIQHEVQRVVELHDRLSRAITKCPLA